MKSMADMVTSMGVTHVKCSKSDSVIYKLMFCHTGSCPTDLTDLHGFVFLGLKKTDINPLKRMGQSPAVRLPLWLYKSKLLTPKP